MLINLFDVDGKELVPGQACYAIPWLKIIMREYPLEYIKVYKYIFWTTCPDGTINPYVNLSEEEKESVILADIAPFEFSLEDEVITHAMKMCDKLYETPTRRIWQAAKAMLDEMARKLHTSLTFGKDGNATDMRGIMKEIANYQENFSRIENVLKEEQAKVKGNRIIPYNQLDDYRETKDYSE